MVPKGYYVLSCFKEGAQEPELIFPKHYEENVFGFSVLAGRPEPRPKIPFMNDFEDVKKFIKERLAGKYEKVLISKVVDIVSVGFKSCYEDKND